MVALADRFGYKKTFIWAYAIMIVSYFLLGQFSSLPAFFLAFMFVAVGAALFKPVKAKAETSAAGDPEAAEDLLL